MRAIYKLDEPDPDRPATQPLTLRAATFYRFPEGDRFDAEGLFYDPKTTSAIVIAKRFDGREAELYSVPFQPPAPLLRPAIPRKIGSLPRFVEPATGASLSADLRFLAVCSYTVARVYRHGRQPDRPWELLAEVRYGASRLKGSPGMETT